ncbi:MAG: amidohydrolase family protein [Acidobacteriota bacterium]
MKPAFGRATMSRRHILKRGLLLGSVLPVATAERAEERNNSVSIIDAHCHAGRGEAMSAPWTTYADPEVTLRRAEKAGITKTVIFPINNPTYDKANQEISQIVARYPGHFIGFAKHDPETEAGRIKELLRREVQELGLRGLKLHRLPTREVLDTAAELKIPILFHPAKVADFHMIATAYPQVNFIMAHLGSFASRNWSEHLSAIDVAKRYPNVYLETSSVVFFEYLERAVRELPAEKLIFGTDGPLLDSRVELYKIRLLNLPKEKEERILSQNILQLLPQ